MTYSSNQEYIYSAPEFLVFCVDFANHKIICSTAQINFAEILLIGAIDTGMMAQNSLLAAKSIGIGRIDIGALRNNINEIAE